MYMMPTSIVAAVEKRMAAGKARSTPAKQTQRMTTISLRPLATFVGR
jgi:hypothetical protein